MGAECALGKRIPPAKTGMQHDPVCCHHPPHPKGPPGGSQSPCNKKSPASGRGKSFSQDDFCTKKSPSGICKHRDGDVVEHRRLELLTPTLPVWCATSCANAPRTGCSIAQKVWFVKGVNQKKSTFFRFFSKNCVSSRQYWIGKPSIPPKFSFSPCFPAGIVI